MMAVRYLAKGLPLYCFSRMMKGGLTKRRQEKEEIQKTWKQQEGES